MATEPWKRGKSQRNPARQTYKVIADIQPGNVDSNIKPPTIKHVLV